MKVLFIGPYRGNTGWSNATRNYIRSLISIEDIDLTLRPIFLDSSKIDFLPFEFQELEKKTVDRYDHVIMKSLPFLTYRDSRCGKHSLMTVTESTGFEYSGWSSKLDLMDNILVPDSVGQRYLSKITKSPVHTISESIDVEEIESNDEVYSMDGIANSTFKFYTIAEYSDRKNINKLIHAYLSEFSKLDDVILVLRIYQPGQSPQNIVNTTVDYIQNLKRDKLRRFFKTDLYPPVQIIGERIENITSLHRACNCFVLPSRGEAFNIPAAEALVCGNPVIITNNIGTCDYVTEENGYLVTSQRESCSCKNPPLAEFYTSNEYWQEPNLMDLRKRMREAYEDREGYRRRCENAPKVKELVNYKTVGSRIWSIINE